MQFLTLFLLHAGKHAWYLKLEI